MSDCGKKVAKHDFVKFDILSEKLQLFMIAFPLKCERKNTDMIPQQFQIKF